MKTAIKIYIGLVIVSDVISLIVICAANLLFGLILIPVIVLQLTIPFAVLRCLEDCEDHQAEIYQLKAKLHQLERQYPLNPEQSGLHGFAEGSFVDRPVTTAQQRWSCVKCNTVNREGTAVCENCGAHYSAEQTDLYAAPLTRWRLKEKKQK